MFRKLIPLNCGLWLSGIKRMKLHTTACQMLCSSHDRDLPNPHLPTPLSKAAYNEPDILSDQVRKANSIPRVLELTAMHLEVMNSKHIVYCMENIHELSKNSNNYKELVDSLLKDQTFQALCIRLMKMVRFMDSYEVINVYKTLSSLGLRSNTYVMQSVLKMLGSHLNDMSLNQLTFLNFLLSKQRPNALVDGIKLALPLVLQVQIDQQLDSDDMNDVVSCLQIACRARLKPSTIEKILAAILEKTSVLSADNAVSIVLALFKLEAPVDGYKVLVNASFDIMAKNIDQLNPKQICSVCYSCRSNGFYHSPFFFATSRRVVSEKWNFDLTYDIVGSFYKLSFCPADLMDHFVDTICSESELINKEDTMYFPLNCVEYLTMTGYQPSRISKAVETLCSCEKKISLLSKKHPYLLLKFLGCIATFGHFPQNLLATILDEAVLFECWSFSRKLGRAGDFEKSVFQLLWSLDIYNEARNFKISDTLIKKLMQSVLQRHLNFECPLAKFVEIGLGGSQFVQSGVITPDGHVIDHVIAMRDGNYPVALQPSNFNNSNADVSQQLVPIEDITVPEDAKIVAILVANENLFCKDPEVLKGWMHLRVRNLAKKRYYPVVINLSMWRNLPDREKIPYLMREIKLAVEENNYLKNHYQAESNRQEI